MGQNDLIGNAGVYWVVSELSRRGLVALPTVRNCPGADVLVLHPETGALATLQVKTSRSFVKFWPASVPPAQWQRASHCYVFVRRTRDGRAFEGFLAGSIEVAAAVTRAGAFQQAQGRRLFPVFSLPGSPAGSDITGVERLRGAWEEWAPIQT